MSSKIMKPLVVLAVVACMATPAMAGFQNWDGTGDWADDAAARWSGDLGAGNIPGAGDAANVRSGILGAGTNDGSLGAFANFYIGHPNDAALPAGTATFNMDGGSMSTATLIGVGGTQDDVFVNLSGTAAVSVSGVFKMLGYGGDSAFDDTFDSTSTLTLSDSATLSVDNLRVGVGYAKVGGDENAGNSFLVQLDGGVLTVNDINRGASLNLAGTREVRLNGGTLKILGNHAGAIPTDIEPFVSGLGGANKGGGVGVAYINLGFDGSHTGFAAIPEPSTLTLLGLGGLGLGLIIRRRRRRS